MVFAISQMNRSSPTVDGAERRSRRRKNDGIDNENMQMMRQELRAYKGLMREEEKKRGMTSYECGRLGFVDISVILTHKQTSRFGLSQSVEGESHMKRSMLLRRT